MNSAFQQVLAKAIEDEAFTKKLKENPEDTLTPYDLTPEEKAALKALTPQTLDALRERDKAKTDPKAWRKPANFRETGASVLSAALVILLLYAAFVTFSQVKVVPLTYKISENVQVVDTFDRAKDLLNIFFPLFGAVVTFWMGVTVEGRRADRSEAEAEKATGEKVTAEIKAEETIKTTQEVLDSVQATVEQAQLPGAGFEGRRSEQEPDNQAALQQALQTISEGRKRIMK